MLMIGRTRREIGAQTPTAHSNVFARSRSDLLGSRDLGCPRMEKVVPRTVYLVTKGWFGVTILQDNIGKPTSLLS